MPNRFMKFAITTAFITAASTALAGPSGGVVSSGQGQIVQKGLDTTIKQGSEVLDINWRDFSSKANETITFKQPDANAIAVNYVNSGIPSSLAGILNSNGRVAIINNAGVTFVRGSQTNVGALTASTAKNFSFDTTNPSLMNFSGADAAVVNNGTIKAKNGGVVYFAGTSVKNTGTITANKGQVGLYAFSEGQVDTSFDGGNIGALPPATNNLANHYEATNTGTLTAHNGTVSLISASSTNALATSVINLGGVVDVTNLSKNTLQSSVLVDSGGDVNIKAEWMPAVQKLMAEI